ncbi:MAG TPA: Rieske 2Fe-2S domain-containing protein [Candidatus Binatia bacterium]|nr:Rieske 2Fe-2S domain-containing protein [Candidatus Binatia bacterium]
MALADPLTQNVDATDFVHTGPATLAGRYMRKFWQPVYVSERLKAGQAVPIRIMSEEFTLYRGESGAPYVVGFRCAHRGTQLSVGWVEGDCIRCFYHGWKYDGTGQCVEQPAEDESFASKVKIRSYPTQEHLGLVFAYLGEGAAPRFPRYPQLEAEGVVDVSSYIRHCNYFNTLENGVDQAHVPFTHAKSNFTKFGLNWDIPKITAEETEYGVAMYGTRADGVSRINHYLMPNILYIKGSPDESAELWREAFAWRVPIDDLSHASFNLSLVHLTGEAAERYRERRRQRRATTANLTSAREMADAVLAGKLSIHEIEDRPDIVNIQDHVAQEGQGAIPDRTAERLGRSDAAIILMRKIWLRELRALAEGRPVKTWSLPATVFASSGL